MLKSISLLLFLSFTSSLVADCVQTLEFGAGWRRDALDWNLTKIRSSHISHAKAKSRIHFKDINMWTINGKACWYDANYYIRLSGMYGISDKGRAHQDFLFKDHSYFSSGVSVSTSNPVKRRSEFYDFDLALGYPLNFFDCQLSLIPTIGYTYDRQRILVKEEHDSSHSHHHKHHHHHSSNPFSSPSHKNIASSLHLHNKKESCNYRFSWYGPYLGADLAYSLDSSWVLFTELKGRFLNNCHQKRKSWTGIYFVDDYHRESWAYGFDGTFGTNYSFCGCWYGSLNIDFKWMKAHSTHDDLRWRSVGANLWIGYNF